MKLLEVEEMELYEGGQMAACFIAGGLAAVAIGNFWNPVGAVAGICAGFAAIACAAG